MEVLGISVRCLRENFSCALNPIEISYYSRVPEYFWMRGVSGQGTAPLQQGEQYLGDGLHEEGVVQDIFL